MNVINNKLIRLSSNEEMILKLVLGLKNQFCSDAAEFFREFCICRNRGVSPKGSTSVIYGNDGFADDIRSRIEVVRLVQHLSDEEIEILGFGVDGDGVTWAMEVDSEDHELLEALLWNAWQHACESISAMILR